MDPPVCASPTSPMPHGLKIPDVIITRRTRTNSMCGRIDESVWKGTVKFFCRSKGHGFVDADDESFTAPLFMHISDIEGEYIPRKGDRVTFQCCPMPPRFDKPQAVAIKIIDFTPEIHHKWSDKETPEELKEDQEAAKIEAKMNESLRMGQASPGRNTPTNIRPRRISSNLSEDTIPE